MNEHHEIDKGWWNAVMPPQTQSDFHDVDAFPGGRNTPGAIEREPAGETDHADWNHRIRCDSRSFNRGIADIFPTLEARGLTVCEVREYHHDTGHHFPT
ncbi:MAG: hypothetical protein GDA49_07595 [Rhodospirillales bacterium]|nr:hypothetical protein [Rhodospirillales bacterium]